MKLFRCVRSSCPFILAILLAMVPAVAQSCPATAHYLPNAVSGNQTQISEAAALAQDGQPPHTNFAPAVAYDSGGPYSYSAAVADLRGNGKLDLMVTNYCQTAGQDSCNGTGEVAVLLGNGDGTFQPAVIYSTGAYDALSVAVGDVNGDGIPDLVVASPCQEACTEYGVLSVLLGNGDGTFRPATTYSSAGVWTYSVAVADLRGNGTLDLVATNTGFEGAPGSVGVLLGNGDGTFQPAVSYDTGGYLAASVAIGDVNGDGIPDLVVADFTEQGSEYEGGAGVMLAAAVDAISTPIADELRIALGRL